MEIGLICCISNSLDDDKYVGSTIDDLSQRLIKHKWEAKRCPHIKLYQKFNELGFDKFSIDLLEEFPYDDKQLLRNREGEYIRQLGTLNTKIAGRTQKERGRNYLEKNREHVNQLKRERRAKNNEASREKDKEYDCKHTERINEPIVCECGRTVSRQHIAHHKKSKVHLQIMNQKEIKEELYF